MITEKNININEMFPKFRNSTQSYTQYLYQTVHQSFPAKSLQVQTLLPSTQSVSEGPVQELGPRRLMALISFPGSLVLKLVPDMLYISGLPYKYIRPVFIIRTCRYTEINVCFYSLDMYIYWTERQIKVYLSDRQTGYAFISVYMHILICEYSLRRASHKLNKPYDRPHCAQSIYHGIEGRVV